MSVEDGVMKMRHLPDGLEIAAGHEIEFKPGGFHIMFMNIKHGLKQGDKIKATLVFEKAGSIDVEFYVDAMGVKSPQDKAHDNAIQHHH